MVIGPANHRVPGIAAGMRGFDPKHLPVPWGCRIGIWMSHNPSGDMGVSIAMGVPHKWMVCDGKSS